MVHINWPAFFLGVVFGGAISHWFIIPFLKKRRAKKQKELPDFFKTGYQNPGDNYPPGFDPRDLD